MNTDLVKKNYIEYEPYILFTIMALWCIPAGFVGLSLTTVMIGAAIPAGISALRFTMDMQDIMMENMSKYINNKEKSD